MSPNPSSSAAYLGREPSRRLEDLAEVDGSKDSPQAAGYRDPTIRCRNCQFFEPPEACSKVAGHIEPEGSSRYFRARQTEEPGLEERPEIEEE